MLHSLVDMKMTCFNLLKVASDGNFYLLFGENYSLLASEQVLNLIPVIVIHFINIQSRAASNGFSLKPISGYSTKVGFSQCHVLRYKQLKADQLFVYIHVRVAPCQVPETSILSQNILIEDKFIACTCGGKNSKHCLP